MGRLKWDRWTDVEGKDEAGTEEEGTPAAPVQEEAELQEAVSF